MIGGLEKTVGNTIWCPGDNKEKPYGDLPLIPIDFSKKMIGTVFEDDYKEEHLQNTVDNMNLLYVAFTRAGRIYLLLVKRLLKPLLLSCKMVIQPQIAHKLFN